MTMNIDSYLVDINKDDPLQIIIRGHLYVESGLIQLIEGWLPYQKDFDLSRLSFPLKVDLAIALGLLSPEDKAAYIVLNRLRNRLAHDLETEITTDDEENLAASLNSSLRKLIDLDKHRPDEFPERLRHCISILFISIESRIETLKKHKEEMKQLQSRVEKVLSESKNRKLRK